MGWYNRHTYLHHSFPNILYMDKDITGLLTTSYKNKLGRIIWKINKLFTFNNSPDNSLGNSLDNSTSNSHNIISIIYPMTVKIVSYCIFLQTILYFKLLFYNLYITFNYSLTFVVIMTILPTIIFMILFVIFSQINHIHTTNFVCDKNFSKHQVITAHNVLPNSFLL